MFMFPNEKKRLYEELDTLRSRVALLEYKANYLYKHRYGSKLDGTPKEKPGRKPSK